MNTMKISNARRNRTGLLLACAALAAAPIGAACAQDTTAGKTEPATEEKLPTPQELVDRWIETSGGRANWEKIDCMTQKGSIEMASQGMSGKVVIMMKAPDLMLSRLELPGLGLISEGYDGTTAWSVDPMTGPTIKKGMQLVQVRRQASLRGQMDPLSNFLSSRTIGKAEFGGSECWVVDAMGEDGTSKIYFDAETGRAAGIMMTAATPQGQLEVTVQTGEPRKFGPLELNSRTTISVMGMEQVLLIDSVSFEEIDAAEFKPPPAIQTMVEAAKATPEESNPKEQEDE